MVTNNFEFWFFAEKWWVTPIPTDVKLRTFGISSKASDAEALTLISKSSTFTAKSLLGNLSVVPIPTIVVVWIPMGLPWYEYVSSSPVTK